MTRSNITIYAQPLGGESTCLPRIYQPVSCIAQGDAILWGSKNKRTPFEKVTSMDITLGSKILEYMEENLAEPVRSLEYNSHSFADAIVNDRKLSIKEAAGYARDIVRGPSIQPAFPRLAAGVQGVFGYQLRGATFALHSVIGLGEKTPYCLQIDDLNGVLCVGALKAQLTHFRQTGFPDAALYCR